MTSLANQSTLFRSNKKKQLIKELFLLKKKERQKLQVAPSRLHFSENRQKSHYCQEDCKTTFKVNDKYFA